MPYYPYSVASSSPSATSGITPTGSPFTYQNTDSTIISVLISGGTGITIEFSRDGSNYYGVGLLGGEYLLSPSDRLRVSYTLAPTMTRVPR